jgi:WD40 repeat protein
MLTKNSQSEEKKFSLPPKRMVSGGNDKLVMIWEFREGDFSNPTGQEIGRHDDWVRDVAWCSSIGLQYDMIASCSEDKCAKVWKHDLKSKDKPWSETKITFPEKVPLWKVSWS